MQAIGHVALFATINAMHFIALLSTAPNDLWYVEPVDAADGDGFFLASLGVMTLASPALPSSPCRRAGGFPSPSLASPPLRRGNATSSSTSWYGATW